MVVVDPNLATPRKWSISIHHTRSCPTLSTASAGAKRYPITRPSGKCTSAAFASSSSSLPPAASAALDPFDHLSPTYSLYHTAITRALCLSFSISVCVCGNLSSSPLLFLLDTHHCTHGTVNFSLATQRFRLSSSVVCVGVCARVYALKIVKKRRKRLR